MIVRGGRDDLRRQGTLRRGERNPENVASKTDDLKKIVSLHASYRLRE